MPAPRIDLIGQKHEKLTVIEYAGRMGPRRENFWKCQCECGGESTVSAGNWGNIKSCGCLNAKFGYRRPAGESARIHIFRGYQHGARKRGYFWELSEEDFSYLTSRNCHYCGCAPGKVHQGGKSTGEFTYNGLDRVDNDLGYTSENVVPCCWICNNAKKNLSYDEFRKWITRVALHQQMILHGVYDEEESDDA